MLFKIAPAQCNLVFLCRRAVMCLLEKTCLDKLHSVKSWKDVAHEFNVNESTMYIKCSVLKQKHIENKVMCQSVDKNVVNRASQEPNPLFPLETTVLYLQWCYGTLTTMNNEHQVKCSFLRDIPELLGLPEYPHVTSCSPKMRLPISYLSMTQEAFGCLWYLLTVPSFWGHTALFFKSLVSDFHYLILHHIVCLISSLKNPVVCIKKHWILSLREGRKTVPWLMMLYILQWLRKAFP